MVKSENKQFIIGVYMCFYAGVRSDRKRPHAQVSLNSKCVYLPTYTHIHIYTLCHGYYMSLATVLQLSITICGLLLY